MLDLYSLGFNRDARPRLAMNKLGSEPRTIITEY